MTETTFSEILDQLDGVECIEQETTEDVRSQKECKWLNVFLRSENN